MKKRLSKILWFGDALNEKQSGSPLLYLRVMKSIYKVWNLGEIYICVADADPALFIRLPPTELSTFKALDIEALSKFFIRKDRPDEVGFLIKFLGWIVFRLHPVHELFFRCSGEALCY